MITADELFFTPLEVASFHDTVLEATNISYEDPELKMIFHSLPEDIRNIAHSWGLSDTVFRDDAYVWLQNN